VAEIILFQFQTWLHVKKEESRYWVQQLVFITTAKFRPSCRIWLPFDTVHAALQNLNNASFFLCVLYKCVLNLTSTMWFLYPRNDLLATF